MNEQDSMVYFGDTIKALGDGRIGGYLVRFGDAKQTDLEGDYFSKSTDFAVDFEAGPQAAVYYNHGLDPVMGHRVLGTGTMKSTDDVGIWIEAQLEMRDEYEKAIYQMVKDGKLGWSSGTAPHLMSRKQVDGAYEITRWPLGLDASVTPTPAESRNAAVSIKSLADTAPIELSEYKAELFDVSGNEHSGVAIMAYLAPDVAKQVAAIDGVETPPEEMHITLLWFGSADDLSSSQVATIIESVSRFSRYDSESLAGILGGIGRLSASDGSDGMDVLYASVDVPGLAEMRSYINDSVSRSIIVENSHGYTPHVTLAYLDPNADMPITKWSPIDIVIDSLSVVVGDMREDFKFRSSTNEAQSVIRAVDIAEPEDAEGETGTPEDARTASAPVPEATNGSNIEDDATKRLRIEIELLELEVSL